MKKKIVGAAKEKGLDTNTFIRLVLIKYIGEK